MLPLPSCDAQALQQTLLAQMEQACQRQGGKIPFADFMRMALYQPGTGYYSAGLAKIGEAGDFVTAPMISALYSQTLANQCQQIIKLLGRGGCIMELGAGTGRMACDIMHHLATQQALPEQYYILEVSADLKARQYEFLQEHCQAHFARFVWLDRLPQTPFTGIILANEVIDALPCHLFKISEQHKILEGLVELNHQQLTLTYAKPITTGLEKAIKDLQDRLEIPLAKGYTSEIHLSLNAFIASLSACLEKGVMLFIDYGFPSHEYYHPSRHMGTLMCHYRHHAHSDPLQYIGMQDITSHVDFTALALAGINHGLELAGFTNQGAFLINNGITGLAENTTSDTQRLAFSQQIQKLTHPHEMGELFKVMALSKNFDEPLAGFAAFDQRHRL
ncbi:MAG: class I SAM-dependent methyltransferase [Candidatus Berkiella sp.]